MCIYKYIYTKLCFEFMFFCFGGDGAEFDRFGGDGIDQMLID